MFTLTNPSAITFPRFNADNTVSALTAANFRSAIGAGVGTVTSVIVGSGTPISINNNTTVPEISMAAATSSVNGYLTSTDWTTFNNKQAALGFTPANSTITIATTAPLQGGGNLTTDRTLSILSASETQSGIVNTSSQLFGGSKVFKNRVTIDSVFTLNTTSSIPTQILGINTTGNVNSVGKFTLGSGLNITLGGILQADTTFLFTQSDTLSLNLTSRFAAKLNLSDTLSMLSKYLRRADTTSMLLPYLRRADTTLMLTPYLRKTDTTNMLLPYFRDADTSSLNLTSRFAAKLNYTDTSFLFTQSDTNQLNLTNRFSAKQNTLNGTGFVKASGTNITYDNSSYLTTGTAASTYLPLTGGTLTGGLTGTTGSFNTITGTNVWESGNLKIQPYTNYPSENFGIVFNSLSLNETMDFYWFGYSEQPRRAFRFMNGSTNSEKMRIEPHTGYVGINDTTPSTTLDVNGTLNATGVTTLGSTLAVTGAVTLSTTTATPSTLLGKSTGDVVGTVTTVAQTGLMKAGSTTLNTSSVGVITVPHGLPYTPSQVLVTLSQQSSYIIVCHSITSSNILFTVYDSITGNELNNVSVGFFWLAIK
jgi:hypothetical protein